jgi:hypothetical protein
MQRKVFDRLTSTAGAVSVVVLVVAGLLLVIGHSYVDTQVHNQLAIQEIYFPPKAVWAHTQPNSEFEAIMKPYMEPYSGQELLTGPQAEVYADHFIRWHLYNMPFHGVYAKVSAAAMAAKPGSAQATQLSGLEDTVFKGTTLRAMLLEGYAFWKIGEVMLWGAIASFILAAIMAALVAAGFAHARATAPEKQLFAKGQTVAPAS